MLVLVNGYIVNSTQLISPIFRKEFVLSKERVFPNATPKHIQINVHTQKFWTILCFVLSKVCFTFESAPSPHFHRFFNYLEIVSFRVGSDFQRNFCLHFFIIIKRNSHHPNLWIGSPQVGGEHPVAHVTSGRRIH